MEFGIQVEYTCPQNLAYGFVDYLPVSVINM